MVRISSAYGLDRGLSPANTWRTPATSVPPPYRGGRGSNQVAIRWQSRGTPPRAGCFPRPYQVVTRVSRGTEVLRTWYGGVERVHGVFSTWFSRP